MSEGITPGRGAGVAAATVAGGSAAILPVTGAHWAVPVAAGLVLVSVVWSTIYLLKTKTR